MLSDGLMAQAVADTVGATKRQIQIWTDGGVLECRPETDRRGRGRQRIYDHAELKYAAMATMLSRMNFSIGDLKRFVTFARIELEVEPVPGIRKKRAKWLIMGLEPGKPPFHVFAGDKKMYFAAIKSFPVNITVNLEEIMGPYWVNIDPLTLSLAAPELAK